MQIIVTNLVTDSVYVLYTYMVQNKENYKKNIFLLQEKYKTFSLYGIKQGKSLDHKFRHY